MPVVLYVKLCRFGCMMIGVLGVAMSCVCVMSGGFVIAGFVVSGCVAMMLRRVGVMFGCFMMMFCRLFRHISSSAPQLD